MPKCYTEQEREDIIKHLKEVAAKNMITYGIRKTTVDKLVKQVGIPKGTFYLFYPSKEQLLFEVLMEVHDRIDTQMKQSLRALKKEEMTLDHITNVIYSFYEKTFTEPILKVLNSSEVELLWKKLPNEVIANHLQEDSKMLDEIVDMMPLREGIDSKAVGAAFFGIYFATLHREEMGMESFEEGLRLMIRGVIAECFEL